MICKKSREISREKVRKKLGKKVEKKSGSRGKNEYATKKVGKRQNGGKTSALNALLSFILKFSTPPGHVDLK